MADNNYYVNFDQHCQRNFHFYMASPSFHYALWTGDFPVHDTQYPVLRRPLPPGVFCH
jgi:hypothetical protein